jgi:hypothetical protein
MSSQQEVCVDLARASTFTIAALDIHPAGMDASLHNSDDAPPTTKCGGIESKSFFSMS